MSFIPFAHPVHICIRVYKDMSPLRLVTRLPRWLDGQAPYSGSSQWGFALRPSLDVLAFLLDDRVIGNEHQSTPNEVQRE
jgi:hypothetical protein